jgi:hypothetical protein
MTHHRHGATLLSLMQKVVGIVPLTFEGHEQVTRLNRAGIGVHPQGPQASIPRQSRTCKPLRSLL